MIQHHEIIYIKLVAHAVHSFSKEVGTFEGTPTELHQRCKEYLAEDDLKDQSWPKAVHAFSRKLNEVAHNLREMGVMVEVSRKRERMIRISYVSKK